MVIGKDAFKLAASEAAEKELRQGIWRVYHRYEVQHTDDGRPYVRAAQDSLESYDSYRPLADYPTLFLKFARLADEGEITQEVWLEWIEAYGVLGLDPDVSVRRIARRVKYQMSDLGQDAILRELERELKHVAAMDFPYGGPFVRMQGSPKESYRSFVSKARIANGVLEMYEAFNQHNPDVELMESLYREYLQHIMNANVEVLTPQELRTWGLSSVRMFVNAELRHECYPTIYSVGDESSLGWAFESLLGALYLQMAWLLIAKEEIHCKQCGRVIDYEQPEIPWEQLLEQKGKRKPYKTRSDKEFCSKSCANKWYYEKVRKPRLVGQ